MTAKIIDSCFADLSIDLVKDLDTKEPYVLLTFKDSTSIDKRIVLRRQDLKIVIEQLQLAEQSLSELKQDE